MWSQANWLLCLKYQRVSGELGCTTSLTVQSVILASPQEPRGDKVRQGSEAGLQSSNCKFRSGSLRVLFLDYTVWCHYEIQHTFIHTCSAYTVITRPSRPQLYQVSVLCLANQSINSLQCQIVPSDTSGAPAPQIPWHLSTHAHTNPASCGMEKSMLNQSINAKALWVILYINSWH